MNQARLASRGNLRTWLASSINELAIAWWTCTSYYLMFATNSQNEFLLFFPLAIGVPLFLALTWRKPVIAHVDPIVSTGVFLLMISIVGSYLFNSYYYELVQIGGNVAASILMFISLYVIVMKMELDLRKLLVFQAVYIEILMPAVIRSSDNVWGRLEPTCMTMNYASMMGIVAFFGALAARNIFLKGALSVLPLYTMVMMQSRGSMMATIFGTFIIIGCWVYENWSRKLFQRLSITFVFAGIACVGAALAGYSIFDFIGDTATKLFMLDDSQRGMGSGASGRSDLWAAAYNLWATHPLFGVGFKGHTQFMPDNMLAHNAFLGLLADNGLVGLVGYLMIIVTSMVCLFRRGPQHLSMFGFRAAILFSYLLYGMIESRAFSFGNTYSVLLLLVAFDTAKFHVARPVQMTAAKPGYEAAPAPQARQIGQPVGISR
jgi:O-antigen ligase